MEQLIPYIPAAVVVTTLVAISVKLKDHPTFNDVTTKDTCNEKHKVIDEKLGCIPEIKETLKRLEIKLGQIEVLIKQNGKKF